jgi:dihydroorotate dehydrogenase (NAD+) catalytic subunit
MVWEVCQTVHIPVIGIGGIRKAEDAIEFLLVGASAIQIGTANLVNPKTGAEVIRGIEDYLVKNRIDRVENLIGLFNKGRVPLKG